MLNNQGEEGHVACGILLYGKRFFSLSHGFKNLVRCDQYLHMQEININANSSVYL